MTLQTHQDGSCFVVTLNRPDRRNAINAETLEQIDSAVSEALESDARTIVITGTGGHFCAGADLKELEDLKFTERLREVLDHIAEAPIPVIAAVSGACMGLGVQLALASDIVVATNDSYFGVPVAKLGLMVDHWTLNRLVATFGSGAVRLMTMTAERVDFEFALARGFIQVEGDLAKAIELAHKVDALAPLTLQGTKLGLNLLEQTPDEQSYRDAFRKAWESEDLVEGRAAFGERRSPEFKGR